MPKINKLYLLVLVAILAGIGVWAGVIDGDTVTKIVDAIIAEPPQ